MTDERTSPSPASGYDPEFLGLALPFPASGNPDEVLIDLDYVHFSLRLNTDRRLAEVTAVNIDGAELLDLGRGDDWHLDDRVAATDQAGPEIYAKNDFDRGHLVRRRDPVWGDDAQAANLATFVYTNAAPQVNVFNQSKELWSGLEDYVLEYADSTDERIIVLTGPVFADDDPLYRGIRVPQKFFKIAGWMSFGELAATAYLLDQSEMLGPILRAGATAAPELGAYRTFQVSVDEVARLTNLDLTQFAAADRLPTRQGTVAARAIELLSSADLVF